MNAEFDAFVGIDWSGAREANGIAIAECPAGAAAPRLVPPVEGRLRWSRAAALAWLIDRADRGDRVLVGLDFAFSLPGERVGAFLQDASGSALALWDLVERASDAAPDLFGGAFTEHPEYAAAFWRIGARSAAFAASWRCTEAACRDARQGSPESVFKLIGPKQVGKAALAGMRVLRALRQARPAEVAVWPFDDRAGRRLVCVEIFPRLFLSRCGFRARKVRSSADLDDCLATFDSAPMPASCVGLSDHESDALVTAAGLRWLVASGPSAWSPAGLDERVRRQEGWIFGVGA